MLAKNAQVSTRPEQPAAHWPNASQFDASRFLRMTKRRDWCLFVFLLWYASMLLNYLSNLCWECQGDQRGVLEWVVGGPQQNFNRIFDSKLERQQKYWLAAIHRDPGDCFVPSNLKNYNLHLLQWSFIRKSLGRYQLYSSLLVSARSSRAWKGLQTV